MPLNISILNRLNSLTNYSIGLSAGYMNEVSVAKIYGFNGTITTETDPEDIWELGGTYTFSSTANISKLSSSSTADTVIPIKVIGLDSNWALTTQYKTLNGQNKVTLDTSLIRVISIENSSGTYGGTNAKNIAGTVYCYVDGDITTGVPNDLTTVRATINDGNNISQIAIYTIPAGKTGFLFRGEAGIKYSGSLVDANDYATISYRSREYGGVFKAKKFASLVSSGNSSYTVDRIFPETLPAKTDILLRCDEVSATMGIWGELNILLIDNL